MIRTVVMILALLTICPLLAIGFLLRGLGMLFIKPACWIGNRVGGWIDGGNVS